MCVSPTMRGRFTSGGEVHRRIGIATAVRIVRISFFITASYLLNGELFDRRTQLRGETRHFGLGVIAFVFEPGISLVSRFADHAEAAIPIGLLLGAIRIGDLGLQGTLVA